MEDIVQQVFNEISLERNPAMWQSEIDNKKAAEKRIKFLAEFNETSFEQALSLAKSPARKNDVLANALQLKSEKATESDALKLLSQALCFASEEKKDQLIRKRSKKWEDLKKTENALKDLLCISKKESEDITRIENLAKNLKFNFDGDMGSEEALECVEGALNDATIKPKPFSEHKTLKEFSDKIKIQTAAGRGRFLVAGEDIEPGQMIAMDTSYAALLDRAHVSTNCDTCMLPAPYPVPCPSCSMARFCSKVCQQQACSTHHQYECLIQDTLYKSGTGAWQLAYRIVAAKPLTFWLKMKEKFREHDEDMGLGGVYTSHDIMTVFNMVTHDTGEDRNAPQLMKECLTALFFLRCLQFKNYFGKSNKPPSSSLSEDELYIALLLHHFMRVVFYNSHEAMQVVAHSNDKWHQNKVVRIGVCLNPSLALINHSCDPNYGRVGRGRQVTAFATRKIKKGEEILDVYSGTYLTSDIECRGEVHTRYNFACQCRACQDNWPTEQLLPRNISKKHIQKEMSDKAVKKLDNSFKEVCQPRWQGSVDSCTARTRIATLLRDCVVNHPHWLVAQAEDLLHKTLWDLYGK